VNSNFLPATTGLSLGSSVQQWLLNGNPAFYLNSVSTTFSTTPVFISSAPFSVFTITLTGNVTFSTLNAIPGLMIFQITQDAAGNRIFTWPTNFQQPGLIGTTANQVTTLLFYFDGTNAWPLAPQILTP
jgi:hypothetical protein